MLLRFIFYSILAYLVIRAVRRFLGLRPIASRQRMHVADNRTSRMVRCESCGTFVAETRALLVGNKEFCSKVCAENKGI
jgi:hypothetical protein